MQEQERQLILDLANRLKNATGQAQDVEAANLIASTINTDKNSIYYLVQAVLLQQLALMQAQNTIKNLQQQLAAAGTQKSSSFLGGLAEKLFGPNPSSRQPAATSAAYGNANRAGYTPPPNYNAPPSYAPTAGSSFLSSAASTAMGVAGGMFLFEGLHNMFSGSSSMLGGNAMPLEETTNITNNYFDPSDPSAMGLNDASSLGNLPDPTLPTDTSNFDFDNSMSSGYDDGNNSDFNDFGNDGGDSSDW